MADRPLLCAIENVNVRIEQGASYDDACIAAAEQFGVRLGELRFWRHRARLSPKRLRAHLYAWNGGQDSPTYAAASSGLVDDVAALQAELRGNLEWLKANPRAQAGAKADERYLERLIPALPELLGPIGKAWDGRYYRAFAWSTTKLEFN